MERKLSLIELPHGASIDEETGTVYLVLGHVTLNFSLEEWMAFATVVDDINTVLQVNTVEELLQCQTCNTVSSHIRYEEPDEKEIN